MEKKRYGLILSQKTQNVLQEKPSVFIDSSDEESSPARKVQQKKEDGHTSFKKQVKLNMQAALEEDPTVFEYDSIYDSMQRKRETLKSKHKTEDRKPRYIAALLQTAEKRKRENERRIERKVQREREEEGDEFRDKDAFVTSSYKKKMLELQEEEERERREHHLEEMMDVTKQKDLSGFYRHLLNQKTGEEKIPTRSAATDDTLVCHGQKKQEKHVKAERQMTGLSPSENSSRVRVTSKSGTSSTEALSKNKELVDTSPCTASGTEDLRNRLAFSKDPDKPADSDSDLSADSESYSDDDNSGELKKEEKSHRRDTSPPTEHGTKDIRSSRLLQESEVSSKAGNTSSSSSSRSHCSKAESPSIQRGPKDILRDRNNEGSNNAPNSKENKLVDLSHDEADSATRSDILNGNQKSKYIKRNVGEKFDMARQRYLARKAAQ